MAKRKSPGKRVTQPEAETKPNPESNKELREREAIGEREKLLDELTPPPDREALLDELAPLLRSGGRHQAAQGKSDETRRLVLYSGEPFNLETSTVDPASSCPQVRAICVARV